MSEPTERENALKFLKRLNFGSPCWHAEAEYHIQEAVNYAAEIRAEYPGSPEDVNAVVEAARNASYNWPLSCWDYEGPTIMWELAAALAKLKR